MVTFRKVRYWIYVLIGQYAPDVCVFCGILTGLALPNGGYPCCANCETKEATR